MFELIPFDRTFRRVAGFDPFRDLAAVEHSFGSGLISAFRTDISDTGDAFVLECELPGFKKEDINISIEKDCLSINVERRLDNEEKKNNLVRRERFYGSFSRSFDVTGINTDSIEAKYEDGVLTLTLPRIADTAPASRRLEIQ